MFNTFCSAWIPSQNICDFVHNKATFCTKNNTKSFKNALREIEEELRQNKIEHKITLKDVAVDELLTTFNENQTILQDLFNRLRSTMNHQIHGNGYDFLEVLSHTLTQAQQQAMYNHMVTFFMGSFKKYYEKKQSVRPLRKHL